MVTRFESFDVTRFYDSAISDFIGIFFLKVVYSDLISIFECIEKCEYIIVLTFDPGIVRRVPENKYISRFAWLSCPRIADDSFFELFHEGLVHRLECRS